MIAWTAQAHPRVTTSVAIVRFPPRHVAAAFAGPAAAHAPVRVPGDAAEGVQLAAPLRGIAPIYIDKLGALPIADVAHIFDDPPGRCPPGAAARCSRASIRTSRPRCCITSARQRSPFLAAEVRHLGEATARDAPGGSATGGRGALFTLALIGANPTDFAAVLPDAEARLVGDLGAGSRPRPTETSRLTPRCAAATADVAPAGSDEARGAGTALDPDGLFG